MRWHQGQLLFEGNRRGAVFTVVLPPFRVDPRGASRVDSTRVNNDPRGGRRLRLAKPEDVAIRIAEPCPARRADLRDVAGGRQWALAVVNESDFALLEFANHCLDIAHLEMSERVIGRARCPAEN